MNEKSKRFFPVISTDLVYYHIEGAPIQREKKRKNNKKEWGF